MSEEYKEESLRAGEYHPAADSAMKYIQMEMQNTAKWAMHLESFGSTYLSGNRLAQLCLGTIRRLEKSEPVSDRYLLGLAWSIREINDLAQCEEMKMENKP